MRLAGAWKRKLAGRFVAAVGVGAAGAAGVGIEIAVAVAAGGVGAYWGHFGGLADMAAGEPSFVRTTWWGVRD